IMDEEGVYDARLGVGKILWTDVESVQIEMAYRTRFVCLRVKDPMKFVKRASKPTRNKIHQDIDLGFSSFNIDLTGVNVNLLSLKQYIEMNMAG
ncbi:MAG: STM3941 family protein, partial [Bdellovibrionota bacterium]